MSKMSGKTFCHFCFSIENIDLRIFCFEDTDYDYGLEMCDECFGLSQEEKLSSDMSDEEIYLKLCERIDSDFP